MSQPRVEETRSPDRPRGTKNERIKRGTRSLPSWRFDHGAPGHGMSGRTESLRRALRIAGPLDFKALGSALRAVVARHEGLRATFGSDERGTFQRIDEHVSFALNLVDVGHDPRALALALETESRLPLDPLTGPLFRATLFRVEEQQHVLFLALHRLIADVWSLDVIVDDLDTLYRAEQTGNPQALPPLLTSCSEYMEAEEERLTESRVRAALEATRARLEGFSEPLQLPLDRPRPAVFTHRGAAIPFELPEALVERLSALAEARGATLDSTLLAAFTLLLSRYSGQKDVVTGYAAAHRSVPESRGLVGRLSNTLLVRARFDDDPDFLALIDRTRAAAIEAATYEDVPFALLAKELEPERDASRTPVFQALFRYTTGRPTAAGADTGWTPFELPEIYVEADVTLAFAGRAGKLVGRLEYCADLFDRETAERLGKNYERLLESAVENPERATSELDIVHPDERAALRALNQTARPVPNARGFHELIRAQALRTPDRTAVVWGQNTMSYDELERSSNRLANLLLERGVQRGTRVGIAVGRNPFLLEATLAIAKVGAAYVPLDPEYPTDRLAYMIEDASIRLILSESAFRSRLPAGDFEALLLDEQVSLIHHHSDEAPRVEGDPSDVGYVIYTSGSTGRPKGVQVPQGAIVNFLASMADVPGCTADDRLVAVTTLSFDIAVLELYLPLTVGARTIIAPRECLMDGEKLAKLLAEHDATIMQATPVTWQLLLDAGWAGARNFKALCGGEAFPRRLARQLVPRCTSVWNMYGPTETTVWSTCQRLTDPEAPILVGHPIANTETYVLDAKRQLVPFGVAGELCIGGLGVTHGYLERPELTEERFIEDRFSGRENARLYRTGDLARQWPHGLELIGRVDNQVKLRGHRIELGEIEALLESDAQILRSAVLVREFGADDSRLVAYLTRAGDGPIDEARLRAALAERLPVYMVPRHFVELPRMPLTPNGKIDRKALPLPDMLTSAPAEAREKPANAIEELLLGVWRRILKLDAVGVTDDFFELGGHSLLALKLLQGINEACKTELPLGFVFESRTIRKQAEAINLGQKATGPTVVPLQVGDPTRAPLFCICGISLYQTLGKHLGPSRPVYGIFVPAEQALLEDHGENFGVRELAREYVRAILETRPDGPYYLAGVSFGGSLAYEVAQQLRALGKEVGFVAILDVVVDEPPSSQRAWTTDRIARVVERGPRYWLEKARELVGRAIEAGRHDRAGLRTFVDHRILPRLPARLRARLRSHESSELDAAAELARLNDLRDRHYDRAWRAYRPELQPYDGAVIVFRARDEEREFFVGEDCGWGSYVPTEKLACHTVPGDHLGILQEPHVEVLAELLRAHFPDEAQGTSEHLAAE